MIGMKKKNRKATKKKKNHNFLKPKGKKLQEGYRLAIMTEL